MLSHREKCLWCDATGCDLCHPTTRCESCRLPEPAERLTPITGALFCVDCRDREVARIVSDELSLEDALDSIRLGTEVTEPEYAARLRKAGAERVRKAVA